MADEQGVTRAQRRATHALGVMMVFCAELWSHPAIAGKALWEGTHGSADAACRAKALEGDGGTTIHDHTEQKGDVAHCYTKSKNDDGPATYSTAVMLQEVPDAPELSEDGSKPSAEANAAATSPPSSACSSQPAQDKYPEEKALGMTEPQIKAMERFIGKTFDTIPDLNLNTHWNQGVDPADAKTVSTTSSTVSGTTKESLRKKIFDKTRDKFWKAVYDDTGGAKKAIEEAGFLFAKRGNAPQLKFKNDPKQTLGKGHKDTTSLDVDHKVRLTDDPSRMLDPNNLRLILARENRVGLEQTRKQDPFQDCK
jgi:hypothetical protein